MLLLNSKKIYEIQKLILKKEKKKKENANNFENTV